MRRQVRDSCSTAFVLVADIGGEDGKQVLLPGRDSHALVMLSSARWLVSRGAGQGVGGRECVMIFDDSAQSEWYPSLMESSGNRSNNLILNCYGVFKGETCAFESRNASIISANTVGLE